MSTNCLCVIPASIMIALLTGCAGNGEGLDLNGRPISDATNTVLTADFNSIQDNVFTPVCSVCHAGATAPQGLRLDQGNSYALLVGIPSSEVPGLSRVQPGNPEASYLLQKIAGSASVGERMPLGGPYLPQTTIAVIRQWIANGANKSASKSTPIGLRVETTAPLNNAAVATAAQIVIGFSRELDANLVNATTVELVKLNAGQEEAVATQLTIPKASTATLIVTPRTVLTHGIYRLALRGSGGGALASVDGQPLNASAATTGGSDFAMTFTIEAQP